MLFIITLLPYCWSQPDKRIFCFFFRSHHYGSIQFVYCFTCETHSNPLPFSFRIFLFSMNLVPTTMENVSLCVIQDVSSHSGRTLFTSAGQRNHIFCGSIMAGKQKFVFHDVKTREQNLHQTPGHTHHTQYTRKKMWAANDVRWIGESSSFLHAFPIIKKDNLQLVYCKSETVKRIEHYYYDLRSHEPKNLFMLRQLRYKEFRSHNNKIRGLFLDKRELYSYPVSSVSLFPLDNSLITDKCSAFGSSFSMT